MVIDLNFKDNQIIKLSGIIIPTALFLWQAKVHQTIGQFFYYGGAFLFFVYMLAIGLFGYCVFLAISLAQKKDSLAELSKDLGSAFFFAFWKWGIFLTALLLGLETIFYLRPQLLHDLLFITLIDVTLTAYSFVLALVVGIPVIWGAIVDIVRYFKMRKLYKECI